MEGTSLVAQHLLQLATNLGSSQNHRAAALAFSTAARTPGVSPRVQAFALYKSALHLQTSVEEQPPPSTAISDCNRALALVRKCFILIRNQPASQNIRLQLRALLERIYTSSADHLHAAKTINDGLADITTHPDRAHVLRWWVYFRGRAIRNALATGNSLEQAAQVAQDSANQCQASGDMLSAAAFGLANAQVLLAMRGNARLDFQHIAICLREVERGERQQLDVTMLTVGMHFLHTLSYLRLGKIGDARKYAIDPLLRAYANLRAAHKTSRLGSWHWFTAKVTSSLTNHCVTMVGRLERAKRALAASEVALKRIGVYEDMATRIDDVCRNCCITKPAARALSISLLDSTARLHLAKLELPEARRYIATAARFAFEETSELQRLQAAEYQDVDLMELMSPQLPLSLLIVRGSVLLLFAEYHCLRGVVSGAHAAMRFITTILAVASQLSQRLGEQWKSDVLQSARSHLSLLTGEERQNGTSALTDKDMRATNFDNVQCYATALLTMGVYYMRHDKVVESVGALNGSLRISLDAASMNAQVAANTLTIRSAPGLVHQRVSSSPTQDIEDAMAMANELGDPVLAVRVAKQYRKMLYRLNQSAEMLAQADNKTRVAGNEMVRKQRNIGMILAQI